MRPASYDITIPQRATFRQHFVLPFNCNGHTVVAQVWSEKRRSKIIEFTVEWTNRAGGEFDLVAGYDQTSKMTKDGEWDLMLLYPNQERYYWIEGRAILDPGYTDPGD